MTAVSVDLGSGTTVGTSASIGVDPHVNWQQEFGFPNFTSTNLEDDSTAATTLDLELAGAAGNLDTRASGSGDLFNMFTRGAGCRIELEDTVFQIDQIPYTTYNVYLYFCESSSSTSGPVYEITDGTTAYYYETQGSDNFDSGTLTRVTSESSGTPDATGNYILFEGLSSSSLTITCNGDSGNANDLAFVGLQIVEDAGGGAISISGSQDEAGDTESASVQSVVRLSASQAELGDQQTGSIQSVVGIGASQAESGDTQTGSIESVVSISASQVESGDLQTGAIISLVQLSASQTESGDTQSGSVALLLQISASQTEVDDTQSGSIVTEAGQDIDSPVSLLSKTAVITLESNTQRITIT